MMICRFSSSGMSAVVKENATRKDFADLKRSRIAEYIGDDNAGVDVLSTTAFEVWSDSCAATHMYRLLPDNWPINYGEPARIKQ